MARPPGKGAGTRTTTLVSKPPTLQLPDTRGQGAGRNRPPRQQGGTPTIRHSDQRPKVVLEEVFNSFLREHNTEDGELSAELILHSPNLYIRTQRRDMHRTPLTIWELDEVLYKLQPGNTPGVHGTLPQAPTEPKETLGRAPVEYRHRENRCTTRLGEPVTPAV